MILLLKFNHCYSHDTKIRIPHKHYKRYDANSTRTLHQEIEEIQKFKQKWFFISYNSQQIINFKKHTSFASFSRRRGLFKPSSGMSSKATVIEESCSLKHQISDHEAPRGRSCTTGKMSKNKFTRNPVPKSKLPLTGKLHLVQEQEILNQLYLVLTQLHHGFQTAPGQQYIRNSQKRGKWGIEAKACYKFHYESTET